MRAFGLFKAGRFDKVSGSCILACRAVSASRGCWGLAMNLVPRRASFALDRNRRPLKRWVTRAKIEVLVQLPTILGRDCLL